MKKFKFLLTSNYYLVAIAAFFLLAISYQLSAIKVSAQNSIPLVVSPARQEVLVDPGESTNVNVRFYNQASSPLSGIVRVADFIVYDKEGSPQIIDNVKLASPRFSGSTWINLPYENVTIAANDKISMYVPITVPANAKPGGRYVAVYFEPNTGVPQSKTGQGAGSGLASRIASLLYIQVKGDTFQKAIVNVFSAPSFMEFGPVTVKAEILNRGDFHIRPIGAVTMTDMFGRLVDQSSLKEQNIFPDTVRTFENSLGKKWMFGRYTVNLAASYASGKTLESSLYLWIMPWRLIAIVILGVAILWSVLSRTILSSQKHVEELQEKLQKEEKEIEDLRKMVENIKE